MLTEEGQQVARECLMRSGLLNSEKNFDTMKGSSILESCDISDRSANHLDSDVEVTSPSICRSSQNKSIDVPLESLERVIQKFRCHLFVSDIHLKLFSLRNMQIEYSQLHSCIAMALGLLNRYNSLTIVSLNSICSSPKPQALPNWASLMRNSPSISVSFLFFFFFLFFSPVYAHGLL